MNLILNIFRTVNVGALLLRHHLLHNASDFQRECREGEVFVRCPHCWWRSSGVQTGPPRLATRLSGNPARLRLGMSA
jgi:hypothetical protein